MIEVSNIYKSFTLKDKRTLKIKTIAAVQDISFSVLPGEIYGLLGPNGAGKSTTLRMIATLMSPEKGSIKVSGLSTTQHPNEVRAKLGFLATDMDVYERFTPREQLKIFGEFQGMDPESAEKRGLQLLDNLGILDFANVKMDGFSSGQRQKFNIARALLHDPQVIIFDEPTTGLDVLTAKTVLDLLINLKTQGKTIILSTHILPMVEKICSKVGIIYQGKLQTEGSPKQVMERFNSNSLDEVFFTLADSKEPKGGQ
ncbi:MAG: ABC transporter ATP-binding protein [Holophagaceae bacterium]|jgi:sodium transport system ATP-binding protein